MEVERWNLEEDGPFSEAALRRKMEERGYFVSRYVYPPGTCFPDHTHELDKLDAVVSGRFHMATEAGSAVLEAGDCAAVPRGMLHTAEVVGDEPVVSLDGIHYG
jgi:quercetin dioxygenase-like cupin family protein